MLRSFDSTCEALGLAVNKSKTKLITVLPPGQTDPSMPFALHICKADIQIVDTFAYLGCLVIDDCNAMQRLIPILRRPRRLSALSVGTFGTKWHLLKSVILPLLLYGLESAALLSHYLRRLQACNNSCLHIILGISLWEKKRNTYIREQAHLECIETTLMRCDYASWDT